MQDDKPTADHQDDTGEITVDKPPFSLIPNSLTRDTSLSLSARVVYANLMVRADKLNNCYPGIRKIASDIGISTATAQKAISDLEASGWITVIRQGYKKKGPKKGQRKSNRYHVHLEPVSDIDTGSRVSEYETTTYQKPRQSRSNNRDVTRTIEQEPPNKNQLRQRDELWDAFCEVHGQPASKTERGKYNKAVKILREADVAPDEYVGLVAAYAEKYDQLQPSVMTVVTRVGEMRHYRDRGAIKVPTRDEAEAAARWAKLEAEYGTEGVLE